MKKKIVVNYEKSHFKEESQVRCGLAHNITDTLLAITDKNIEKSCYKKKKEMLVRQRNNQLICRNTLSFMRKKIKNDFYHRSHIGFTF